MPDHHEMGGEYASQVPNCCFVATQLFAITLVLQCLVSMEPKFVTQAWSKTRMQAISRWTRILLKPEIVCCQQLDPLLLQPLQDLSQQPPQLSGDLRVSHFSSF